MGLKSLLSRKKNPENDQDLYDYRTITVDEIPNYPNAIEDLYNRKYDGLLIKNVLSQKEVEQVKANLDNLPKDQLSPMPEGFAWPIVFAQLVRHNPGEPEKNVTAEDFHNYFNMCTETPARFKEIFGWDFKERVDQILSAFGGGRKVGNPPGLDGVGSYNFTTVRCYNPGVGNIRIHCGNYFQQEFPEFYKHLSEHVKIKDQLSYFMVVQKPEIGGELALYDLEWVDGQTKDDPAEENIVNCPDGTIIDRRSKNLRRRFIAPEAGDMILFAGGQIWHSVEDVKGNTPRITMGGFLSFSHDGKEICYWS